MIDPIKSNIEAIYEAAKVLNRDTPSSYEKDAAAETVLTAGLGLLAMFLNDIHTIAQNSARTGFIGTTTINPGS